MRSTEILDTEGALSTGTSAKTLLRATAPAGGGQILEASVSFQGLATEALVEIVQGATGGTSSDITEKELGFPSLASPRFTGKKNFSAEPTGGEVIFREYTKTGYTWRFAFDAKPSTNYDIRVTSGSNVNAVARFAVASAG